MIRLVLAFSLSIAISIILAFGVSYLDNLPGTGPAASIDNAAADR